MPLRAGVPVTVIAEIGLRSRIIGTVGLHAVGDPIVTAGGRCFHRDRAFVIISVVFVARRVIAGAGVIAIALRGECATDHGACDGTGNEATAAMTVVTTATTAAVISAATATATTKLRPGCATTTK